jgi:hypothetical protein
MCCGRGFRWSGGSRDRHWCDDCAFEPRGSEHPIRTLFQPMPLRAEWPIVTQAREGAAQNVDSVLEANSLRVAG